MAISTRSDALGVKKEVSEGVPVEPASATDFIALQDDLSVTPAFDDLENAERLNSLGSAKSIRGLENPALSVSHYAKASGVEGQAPNYGPFLESIFGTETSGLTERDTVAASTTTTINVDAGEGTEFPHGRPMLVKDGTNGYSIRWSRGATVDAVDLNFALDNAPAAGVDLGDPVYYSPANSGHPTLSLWHYIGNQANGAMEMTAGNRITSMSLSADAGQLINASFNAEGISYHFDPITITAANNALDFTSDNVTDEPVIVASKTYKDPHDLAEALASGMNTADSAETYTVEYSNTTGKFTVATSTSTVLSLLWSTGTNTATTIGAAIGFVTGSDDTGSTSYEADSAKDWSAPFAPSFDDADPSVAKANTVRLGDQDSNVCFEASNISIDMAVPKTDILSICAESGKSGSIAASREVTISVTALLDNYDADAFHRFHKNQDTQFMWSWGVKDGGGNWVPGKAVSAWAANATLSSFEVTSEDNLATLNLELKTFVDSDGNGEFYLGQL